MSWRPALLLLTAFATVFCTAINCYTLRVAYPLWRSVGAAEFPVLHREYLRRLGPVITFPHIVMFFASAALIRWHPFWLAGAPAIAVFALNATVIAVSAFRAGPIHSRFERSGTADESGLRRLTAISALRSVLMLLASGLLFWWIADGLSRLEQPLPMM